ncbi:MAG: hypothetical protein A3H35_06845 [Betaproteobacteria bacterium RIFCSPLOWO2_02_FULL_62_17]|nr:MAG: hypothetical protein A3H35_06845 [Betaproteobacteria bacterium RIFCSPLOWO2_02_FULL_62_17]
MLKTRNIARSIAFAVALATGLFQPARAVTDEDLKELREQLRQLKQQYESRIEALEKRLQQAERAAGQAAAVATKAETAAQDAALQASSRPVSESAMNPGISLILNGTYGNLSQDPAAYRINGFTPTGGEVAPVGRGLSLGESELVFAANIDPRFRGTLIAALGADETVAIEEGFIQTLGLSNGFTVKAGRFFSNVGYLNQFHPHAWDFADASLASKVFLGNQLGEDGVQVKWVAPTELYFDLGMEIGRGRSFPAGPAGGRNKNGFGAGNLFAHLGGDIGASSAWEVGLSHLLTEPQNRSYEDPDSTGTGVTNSFNGRSRLWALSGVFKWAPNGNSTVNNFKLQGEYFRRTEQGNLTYDTAAASLGTQTGTYASKQSGWYAQGVYQFAQGWRAGYRYDRLNSGATSLGLVTNGALAAADFPVLAHYTPRRSTWMIDWSGSEFSRLRLQFASDKSRAGAPDNQVVLQYIMSLGAHGAHKF